MSRLTSRGGPAQSDLPDLPPASRPPYQPGMAPPPVITGRDLTAGPLRSRLGLPSSSRKVWAPIVSRVDHRQGETHLYIHGDEPVEAPNYGGGGAGTGATPPASSMFQDSLIGPIVNAARNGFLYRAGVPFGIGRPGRAAPYDSIRTQQIATNPVTGGAGAGQQVARPAFTRVQNAPKYRTQPRRYSTVSGRA